MSTRPQVRWWRLVDWRVVAAAGIPVWAAVIGLVAWDKARLKASPVAPAAVADLTMPAPDIPTPLTIAPRVVPPRPAPPPVVVVPVVIPQPAPPRANEPFWMRDEFEEPVLAPEVDGAEQVVQQEPNDGCKGYGTAVRFAKSPTEAMQRAKTENKLLYVLHLSGNLEDDGFT